MRIVHLILSSRFAGSERHALELAAAQARHHDVTLVLRRKAAQDRPDAIAHRVEPGVRLQIVDDRWSRWWARHEAVRRVRLLRPDVAHAHLGAACRVLRSLDGCLRVATLHINYKRHQHAGLDGLIAIAPWQLAAVPEPLRRRTVQIDNWTLPQAPTDGARERLRAEHGIAPDEFVFVAVGRVEAGKGVDVLVEAFERAARPRARLVIAGHGRAWRALRRRAGPRVLMPGFVDRPQDWLQACDAFVSAARSEPFGLVLLEAMEAGLPVLASATEGARHLADVIGRPLLPVGDVAALATALTEMQAERPARRVYPLERFRIEARVREVEAYYRERIRDLRPAGPARDPGSAD